MQNQMKTLALATALALSGVQAAWAANALSGKVAEYNAAQVRTANGQLTVPGNQVTYTSNSAIPAGTVFTVTLPSGFQFVASAPPTLSSSAATFSAATLNGATAKFTVATSTGATSSTIALSGYEVTGASALATITPVVSALPLTMQAAGIDSQPLSLKEFASDSGISAIFVGAIQFLDLSAPDNGKKFGLGSTTDSPTGVFSAIEIGAQIVDSVDQQTPVLSPDGALNSLSSSDTVTVEVPGFLYSGIQVFSSTVSSCATVYAAGTVTAHALIFPKIPLNQELFFCATEINNQPIKLIGFPAGLGFFGLSGIGAPSFVTLRLLPSNSDDDYLASVNVNNEFPGLMCYTYSGASCVNEYFIPSEASNNRFPLDLIP